MSNKPTLKDRGDWAKEKGRKAHLVEAVEATQIIEARADHNQAIAELGAAHRRGEITLDEMLAGLDNLA